MANSEHLNIYNIVGMNIKKYRKQKCMTQRQLAEAIFMSESFIAKLESITFQTISIDTLDKIAHILDTPIMDFFDEEVAKKEDNEKHSN